MSKPTREGWLMCPLHMTWMVPPDATHEGHPEYDGGGCSLVDPRRVVEFLEDNMSEPTTRELVDSISSALWIRDQWLREGHERIRVLDRTMKDHGIVHPSMLEDGEVLPGEQR